MTSRMIAVLTEITAVSAMLRQMASSTGMVEAAQVWELPARP